MGLLQVQKKCLLVSINALEANSHAEQSRTTNYFLHFFAKLCFLSVRRPSNTSKQLVLVYH